MSLLSAIPGVGTVMGLLPGLLSGGSAGNNLGQSLIAQYNALGLGNSNSFPSVVPVPAASTAVASLAPSISALAAPASWVANVVGSTPVTSGSQVAVNQSDPNVLPDVSVSNYPKGNNDLIYIVLAALGAIILFKNKK